MCRHKLYYFPVRTIYDNIFKEECNNMYPNDFQQNGNKPNSITIVNKPKRKNLKVNQFDINGEYIKTFQNIEEAAKEIGISESSIRQACNGTQGRKTAKGFIWKYDI